MIRRQIPLTLSTPLRAILQAELAQGNVIVEVADWPPSVSCW